MKPGAQSSPLTSDYNLDEQVGFLLRKATQRHLMIFAANLEDLTPTQFAALAKLCQHQRVTQNQLGRYTAMDAATIKGVIDRLKKRGLVETSPDPEDKRRLFVEPTPLGQTKYKNSIEAAHEITADTLAPLSLDERNRFLKLLEKLT